MTLDAWEREYAKPDPVWKGPPLGASPFPAGLNILELGCGNGKNLPALLATAAAVTAVDFSHKALQLCREHFTDEKLSLLQADVCELPLADGQFTAVSAFWSICWPQNVLRPLRKLTDYCRPTAYYSSVFLLRPICVTAKVPK